MHALDLKKIQDGHPWSFDRNMFCLTEYDRKLIQQQVVFTKESMWVLAQDLPLGMMNQTYGDLLGQLIGKVEDIDEDKDGSKWGPLLQIKVWIDITKLLIKENMFSYEGTQLWIPFKYERLSILCFKYGIIKHPSSGCIKGGNVTKIHDQLQHGTWLRATPP